MLAVAYGSLLFSTIGLNQGDGVTLMELTERQERVLRAIEAARTATRRTSEFIHANPEVAMTEEKSSAALADLMEEFGFEVERRPATSRRLSWRGAAPARR